MFDNWQRRHTKVFPKRIFLWRVLQNGIDPVWYEGMYEKMIEKTGEAAIESRSLWFRRSLPTPTITKAIGIFIGFLFGALLGWIVGTIFGLLSGVSLLSYVGIGIFGLAGIALGNISSNRVELFDISAPDQSAYQDGVGDNYGKDVIWFLQTSMNQFYPVIYKDKAFMAKITDKIPVYEWMPQLDAEGKQVLNEQGEKMMQRGKFLKFEEKSHNATLFDMNWYLSNEGMTPEVKPIPYVVAYKSSDTYQWLLMQAERVNRFYRAGSFWDKYGNILIMAGTIIAMVVIFVIALNKFGEINQATTTAFTEGMTKLTGSISASFDKFGSIVAEAVRSTNNQGTIIKPPS